MNPAPPPGTAPTAPQLLVRAIAAAAPDTDPHEWAAAQARVVSADWPPSLRRELAEQAFGLLADAVHRYDATRPLAPWANQVLRRKLVDLSDREGRYVHRDLAGETAPEKGSPFQRMFEAIRDVCEAAHFYPNTPDGPDHYAAFVFDLRVRLGERLGRAGDKVPHPLRSAADRLPWPAWLGPRRFRPGWPRVADVWGEAERRERIGADVARVAFIGECVRAVAPGVAFQPTAWNQWVNRAVREVRKVTTPETWDGSFGRLFFRRETPATSTP